MNTFSVVATALVFSGVSAASAFAQDVGRGEQLAMQVCSTCHLVVPNQAVRPVMEPPAPSFQSIIDRSGMNAQFLTNHLLTTHANIKTAKGMPNPDLSRQQAADVAAYMMQMKKM